MYPLCYIPVRQETMLRIQWQQCFYYLNCKMVLNFTDVKILQCASESWCNILGWIYYFTEKGTLFPKNGGLSKQSDQHLRGLAREILQQLLQEKQDTALLADLHLTHVVTYLLTGACQITPWCLVCLVNSYRSVYLSFASLYTPCYFQLMFMSDHLGRVAQNGPCRTFILVTVSMWHHGQGK